MFGLVALFKVKGDRTGEFDRLTRDVLRGVRGEPGTLVYAAHVVGAEPQMRLFYELYRDRAAFEEHEAQEHTRRFLAEREACLDSPPEVTFLTLQEAKGIPEAAGEG